MEKRRKVQVAATLEKMKAGRAAQHADGRAEGTVSKSSDTDEEDVSYGQKIRDLNADEWNIVSADAELASFAALKENGQAAHAIINSIANQFPQLSNDLVPDDWRDVDKVRRMAVMDAGIRQNITDLVDAPGRGDKNYCTKEEVSAVLSNIQAEPTPDPIPLDPRDDRYGCGNPLQVDNDYPRLQFNLAIVRGSLPSETSRALGPVAELIDSGHTDTLYLAYSRVNGRTIWSAMRRKPSKEVQAKKQEGDATTPKHLPGKTYFPSEVLDFDWNEWRWDPGVKHAVEDRRHVTAANSIFDSMQKQYPESSFARNGSARSVLNHLDNANPGVTEHFTAGQGSVGLRHWTNPKWVLVVVGKVKGEKRYKATRMWSGDGPELYVKYMETHSKRGTETRWQPLARKKGPFPWDASWEEYPEPPLEASDEEDQHQENSRPGGDRPGDSQPEDTDGAQGTLFGNHPNEGNSSGGEPPGGAPPGENDGWAITDESTHSSEDSLSSSSNGCKGNKKKKKDKSDDEDEDEGGAGVGTARQTPKGRQSKLSKKAPGAPKKSKMGGRNNDDQGTPTKPRGQKRKSSSPGGPSISKKSKNAKLVPGKFCREACWTYISKDSETAFFSTK